MTWSQTYLLFHHGLLFSSILAATPILTLLLFLGALRKPAWLAGLAGLAVTFVLALAGYHMPVKTALSATCEGVAFGLFPITWIIFWAIVLFRVTLDTGKFEIIKSSIGNLTKDPRLQVLLIAFAFGGFLEGAAGFGAPVAIAATMLTGLGFSAFYASAICLLANTAPVAFGSIGIPIVTLALTTGLPLSGLSSFAGELCAVPALILPAYLIVAVWGVRALSGIWLPTLATGLVYAAVQLAISLSIGPQLTGILASLAAICSLITLLHFWQPKQELTFFSSLHAAKESPSVNSADISQPPMHYTTAQVLYAWLPYGLLVLCVLLWGWRPVHAFLDAWSISFPWPALHDAVQRMPPIVNRPSAYHAIFNLNWFAAAGTSCMAAAVLSAVSFKIRLLDFARLLLTVVQQLLLPTATVSSVLAIAFLMNYCGATATLGLAFAATGAFFPLFSPVLGWIGVFLTGSDTSSNALFGTLQTVTADKLGFNPYLMASANSIGGVMGKMISLQTIAVAAAATGMSTENQARLFRFTLRHSLFLICLVGILTLIFAYTYH